MTFFSIGVAFLAGFISFLSPCVLPIIPGFLAYLAGTSLKQTKVRKRDVFINALFFVLGFSFIFSFLGVLLNSILSIVAFDTMIWVSRLAGIVIIFFGMYLTGIIRVPLLEMEYKLSLNYKFKSRYLTSFVFGAAFAVGWTPCVGAVLGGIIALAVTQPGLTFILLFIYSMGMGVPFLAVALFAAPAAGWIKKYGQWLKYLDILFGIILIILGILVFTRSLNLVTSSEIFDRLIPI